MKDGVIIISILFTLLTGCSLGDQAGTTTETTNGITISVVDSNNEPVPFLKIAAYTIDPLIKTIADSIDYKGEYTLSDSLDIDILEVYSIDSTFMLWFLMPDSKEVKLIVEESGSLIIHPELYDSTQEYNDVLLEGTGYTASMENGSYTFYHLPPGNYTVLVDSLTLGAVNIKSKMRIDTNITFPIATELSSSTAISSSTGISSSSWMSSEINDQMISSSSLVTFAIEFENFENNDNKHLWADSTKSTGWYVNKDEGSEWIKPSNIETVHDAVVFDESINSQVLHMVYTLGDLETVLLGTHLGAVGTSFDLSAVKNIHLKVKGDGAFDVAVEKLQSVDGETQYEIAEWNVSASPEWQTVVINTDDAKVDRLNNRYPFAEISDSISLFSIFIRSGTELWIDDIVFESLTGELF
ncbi:MAG: hypothetical protein OCC49_16555 [Fibrobacterales bacterium]